MKDYIFYFSGTGNTLSVAKKISEKLSNGKVIDIAQVVDGGYRIESADRIGLVMPVYVFGAPLIVEAFIDKLDVKRYQYMYVVFTHGGAPYSAVSDLRKKLENKGLHVQAGFEILTPDNYIEGKNPPDQREAKEILQTTKKETLHVANAVQRKEATFPRTPVWQKCFGSLVRRSLKGYTAKAPGKFRFTSACNGCGACVKLCPRKVIALDQNRNPAWEGNSCVMCFSCINLCPKQAIEIGKKTIGRNRYKNPDVQLSDLMRR